MGRVREVFAAMGREMRKNKGSFAVYVVLRLIVLACAVGSLAFDNYEAFFLCLLTLVLFLVPTFIEVNFSISIPETLEVVIALFIFAAEILGELLHFYTIFPFWDALLHTFNGFLAAAIGLALVSILNRSDRIAFSLSPFFCVVVAFCFSMTIGVLWEFFEFGMDEMFGLDMQKDTVVTGISSTLLDPSGSQQPASSFVGTSERSLTRFAHIIIDAFQFAFNISEQFGGRLLRRILFGEVFGERSFSEGVHQIIVK